MATTASHISLNTRSSADWLRNRQWDLTFISLSVLLVPIPYLVYTLIINMEPISAPIAVALGTTVDDLGRNSINAMVALLIGGPHMYATFSRTAFDADFAKSHSRLVWSSLAIPVVVIALALFNLPLLLTIFFFWASIHVLHQIVYIMELYNQRNSPGLSLLSRVADYGVVLTALYPLAAVRMVEGSFTIGHHNVGAEVESLMGIVGLSMGQWVIWLSGGAFALALGLWLISVYMQWVNGSLHMPKTLFIALTVFASFWVPSLGNLDTAFQGMNFWHSTQYLALTWLLNNIRQKRGELDNSPFIKRLSEDNSQRRFYWFNVGMMGVNFVIGVAVFAVLAGLAGQSFDYAFDRAYYIAVLSILWIHYYQDHYLFTEPEIILGK